MSQDEEKSKGSSNKTFSKCGKEDGNKNNSAQKMEGLGLR